MPSMTLTVPHSLGKEAAVTRLKSLLEKALARNDGKVTDLQQSWVGDLLQYSFSTYGFKIKGDMAVSDSDVRVNSSLPLAALMFKGRVEQTLRDELTKALA